MSADRIKGCLFGQALGDSIGLNTEFLTKVESFGHYAVHQHAGDMDHKSRISDRHRDRWAIGDYTDDTDQMLCILDCR